MCGPAIVKSVAFSQKPNSSSHIPIPAYHPATSNHTRTIQNQITHHTWAHTAHHTSYSLAIGTHKQQILCSHTHLYRDTKPLKKKRKPCLNPLGPQISSFWRQNYALWTPEMLTSLNVWASYHKINRILTETQVCHTAYPSQPTTQPPATTPEPHRTTKPITHELTLLTALPISYTNNRMTASTHKCTGQPIN